jgi:hypothetical protein
MHWAEKNGDIKLTVEWKKFYEFGSRSKKFQRHLTCRNLYCKSGLCDWKLGVSDGVKMINATCRNLYCKSGLCDYKF